MLVGIRLMQQNLPLIGFVIVIFLCLNCRVVTEQREISNDKSHKIEIVIADRPTRSAKFAASELKFHLEKITNSNIQITSQKTIESSITFFIGGGKLANSLLAEESDLKSGGYLLRTIGDSIILAGDDWDFEFTSEKKELQDKKWQEASQSLWKNPISHLGEAYNEESDLWLYDRKGSLNAVYAYLELLGFRWYLPGEIGNVIPQTERVKIPSLDEVHNPEIETRRFLFYSKAYYQISKEELRWQLTLMPEAGYEIFGSVRLGHGIEVLHSHSSVKRDNPEYFALYNGYRDTSSRGVGKPCLSSLGLLNQNILFARSIYDIFDQPIVSVMPGDAYSSVCECELCQGKGTPERGFQGSMSDYVWTYVNNVAGELLKSHPDRKVLCFAYGSYFLPPINIDKLSPNIIVGLCQTRSTFNEIELGDSLDPLRREWESKTDNPLLIREYYLEARPSGRSQHLPAVYLSQINSDLKLLSGRIIGEMIEIYREHSRTLTHTDIAYNHLNLLATSKLYWNTHLDLDGILEDYCKKFYVGAHKEVQEIIEFSQRNWRLIQTDITKIDSLITLARRAYAKLDNTTPEYERLNILTKYIEPLEDLKRRLSISREKYGSIRAIRRRRIPDPIIDGSVTDKFWENLYPYTLRAHSKVQPETTFKVGTTSGELLLAVRCESENFKTSSDTISIYLETQEGRDYQFMVYRNGMVVSMETIYSDLNLQSNFSAEREWTFELSIPFSSSGTNNQDGVIIGSEPTRLFPWYFNMMRIEENRRSNLKWTFSPKEYGDPSHQRNLAPLFAR